MTLKQYRSEKMAGIEQIGGTCQTDSFPCDEMIDADVLQTNDTISRISSQNAPLTGAIISNIPTDADISHNIWGMQRMSAVGIRGDDSATRQTSTIGKSRDAEIPHGYTTCERTFLFLLCKYGEGRTRGGEQNDVMSGGGGIEHEITHAGMPLEELKGLEEIMLDKGGAMGAKER